MIETFIIYFHKYIGVRGILSTMMVCTLSTMLILQYPIPNEFYSILALVLGFHFGKSVSYENGQNQKINLHSTKDK